MVLSEIERKRQFDSWVNMPADKKAIESAIINKIIKSSKPAERESPHLKTVK